MNKYKAHQILVKKAKLAAQKRWPKQIRIKDRHVGKFVPLVFIKKLMRGEVSINDWTKHIVAINQKGMADLYGYFSCHNILIHIEAEAKTGKARQTQEQKDWQSHIESMGGCYILFRSEQDLVDGIENYLKSRKLI